MFRSLVRFQSILGNTFSFSKVCPRSRHLEFALKYSTASTERKRFYQDVSISQGEGGLFEINLDRRKLKTPAGKLFTVPNEALAIAVATEWDAQRDTLKFYSMHLTTLCYTALDNPSQRNKDQMINAALKFLETDTVCYRVDEPDGLVDLQKNEWDPVLHWIENSGKLNQPLPPSLRVLDFTVRIYFMAKPNLEEEIFPFFEFPPYRYNVTIGSSSSILGPEIPEATKNTFRQHLHSYNFWSLTGLEYVIAQLKSVVLTMGLIDRHLSVEQAVLLSRLEEEYQIQFWGNVEWAHDYDMYELRARTAAGALFVHLSSESATVKRKLMQD